METCRYFQDPAEHCSCQRGIKFGALAGGGAHYKILRLPCVPITNRRGEVASRCDKYEPQDSGENDHD